MNIQRYFKIALFGLFLVAGTLVFQTPATAQRLELISLKCEKSTGEGKDELRLIINKDNMASRRIGWAHVTDGKIWNFTSSDSQHRFHYFVNLILMENDRRRGRDDRLGKHLSIPANKPAGTYTYTYENEKASSGKLKYRYVLTYRIHRGGSGGTKYLQMRELQCLKQQEKGEDEIRLYLQADIEQRRRFEFKMKVGDTEQLNSDNFRRKFHYSTKVRLVENDRRNDERLGEFEIPANKPAGHYTHDFTRHGAHYKLIYDIVVTR